jgi:hypothetical protein
MIKVLATSPKAFYADGRQTSEAVKGTAPARDIRGRDRRLGRFARGAKYSSDRPAYTKDDPKKVEAEKPPVKDKVENLNKRSSELRCFGCGKPGYYAHNCPDKDKHPKTPAREYVRAAHTARGSQSDDEACADNSSDEDDDRQSEASQNGSTRAVSDGETENVPYEDYGNDYYARNSDTEQAYAMRVLDFFKPKNNTAPKKGVNKILDFRKPDILADIGAMTESPMPKEGDHMLKRLFRRKGHFKSGKVARARPSVPLGDKLCLITYTKIDGHDAWTLWDAGSTTTSITPAFADVAEVSAFPLLDPFVVQLGTVGSRAKITHGADVEVTMPGLQDKIYVDICNLDRYDLVIGTPFMRRNGVILDFRRSVVTVNGVDIPALPYPGDVDPRLHRSRATDRRAD